MQSAAFKSAAFFNVLDYLVVINFAFMCKQHFNIAGLCELFFVSASYTGG